MRTRLSGRLLLVLGLILALAAAPAAAGDPVGDPEPVPLVAVGYDTDVQLLDLLDAGLDVLEVDSTNREVLLLAHAFEQDYLAAQGLSFEVIHENLNVFPEGAEPDSGPGALSHHSQRTNYRFLPDYYNELEEMAALYPDLTRLETIGHSHQNRPIVSIEISSAPGVADGRPEHVHMALHHAREWPSGELALDLAWYLLENYGTDQRVTDIVDGIRVYIIPVVNPDGFNWSRTTQPLWRKNRNPSGAVDSNRNYGYFWAGPGSSNNPNSQTYRGVAPFSEPETAAVRDFYIDKHLVTTITGHTHGGWWLFPWGHKFAPPPDQELFDLAAASVQWSAYVDGPTAPTLYQASGDTTDWTYGTYRSLSYTPEYGTTGSFHPPFMGTGQQPFVVAGDDAHEGRYLTGSLALSGQNGPLVDCGLALSPADCPDEVEGAIALIERGAETFANKALNAASRGAVAAVIYNNTTGHINGTLAGNPVPVPVMGIPRAAGLGLLDQMAGGEVQAVLEARSANSYAHLWSIQLPAFLINIEAAAEHAARIKGSVTDAQTGEPVSADLDLSLVRRSFRSNGVFANHPHDTSITATGAFDWAVLPSRQPELETPPYELSVSATNYYAQQYEVELDSYRDEASFMVELQVLAEVYQPHQLEAVTRNSTVPFRFYTYTAAGTASYMDEISVSVRDGQQVIAEYGGEGRGSSVVRESGQPGRYLVNIDTNALGLAAGVYDLAVGFVDAGESYEFTVPMTVVNP